MKFSKGLFPVRLRILLFFVGLQAHAAVPPHIGYVYPAGGMPGAELELDIGGQYLKDVKELRIGGLEIEGEVTGYERVYERREAGRIRRMKETLEARREEEDAPERREQIDRALEKIEEENNMLRKQRRSEREDPLMARRKQFNPQIAERISVRIRLPEEAAAGTYELRAVTEDGLSNPMVFRIGSLPELMEREPNDNRFKAEAAGSLPLTVNGRIMPGDVDCFRFCAEQGATLVLRVEARQLIPYLADAVPGWFQPVLTLYDSQGREIAGNDDWYFSPDPVLLFTVPDEGEYIVAIRDSIYRGREDFVYRFTAGALPQVTGIFPLGGLSGRTTSFTLEGVNLPDRNLSFNLPCPEDGFFRLNHSEGGILNSVLHCSDIAGHIETEPNDTAGQAALISGNYIVDGRFDGAGDVDCFRFEGRRGERKQIELLARRLGSPADARVMLFDGRRSFMKISDDERDDRFGLLTHPADPRMNVELPLAGTYYVRIDEVQNKGGPEYAYRLVISDPQPDFSLRIVPSAIRIPRDGLATATVRLFRAGGFAGPVELQLSGAPEGVSLEPAVIPEGTDSATILLRASDSAEEQIVPLEIEGSAKISPGSRITRTAEPAEDMMQAFLWRHLVPAQEFLVQVVAPEPATVTLQRNGKKYIEAAPGEEIVLPLSVSRRAGVKNRIRLSLSDRPEWLSLQTAEIQGRRPEMVLKVSSNAEPGEQAVVALHAELRIPRKKTDPDYNPVFRFLNFRDYRFAVDILPVLVTDKK